MVELLHACEHVWDLRRRQISSGVIIAGKQCLTCGNWQAVPKTSVPDLAGRPWFDENIRDRSERKAANYYASAYNEERQREREERNRLWFEEHNRYLKSPEWRARADRVLRRANFICEACLEARAVQVHHVTYEHWKNEPLFDLRAVCWECHEDITELDRARRAR